MRMVGLLGGVALCGLVTLVVAACSGTTAHSGFDDGTNPSGPGSSAEGGSGPGFGGNGDGAAAQGCQGIGCNRVICNGQPPTTITGQVFDPAGKNPLYNVVVYIPTDPNAPLPALSSGVSCDKCGATALNPVTSALTDENGNFTLTDVPVMPGVPIVVQVGKWRKKLTVDVTTSCAETKMPAPITLPKNGTEGDMPQIAVTTGGSDSLECLLLGMGIDPMEFEQGPGSNHVHLFKGDGGSTGANVNGLWDDVTTLSAYDIVALSCEGSPITSNKKNLTALHDFASAGGRVFATHYQYVWFSEGPADFKGVANWNENGSDGSSTYTVEQNFPKGKSFAQWLKNVGASSTIGSIDLVPADVRNSVTNITPMQSQSWIDQGANDVKYFSFNTPISAAADAQCGRVVFSDIHVSSNGGESFPGQCDPKQGGTLSAQQKALEFIFFDLSSCIQSDQTPPSAPK